MTGHDLWIKFLTAGIRSSALASLGQDLYFARSPRGESLVALKGLTAALEIHPAVIWRAMNIDPGRDTLETLAADYNAQKPWNATAPSTRAYVEKIAGKIAAAGPTVPPPAPPATTATGTKTGPTTTASSSLKRAILWPLVIIAGTMGAILYASKATRTTA